MNAGAYGRELVDVLARYRFLTAEGELVEKAPEPGEFRYRWSVLGEAGWPGLTVRLEEGDPERIRTLVEDYRRRRGTSQPLGKRNAGCIFKNPPGQSAGRLIDQAGLKGLRVGDAEVSPEHGNFLVNLARPPPPSSPNSWRWCGTRVLERHGVHLEPEVEIWAAADQITGYVSSMASSSRSRPRRPSAPLGPGGPGAPCR